MVPETNISFAISCRSYAKLFGGPRPNPIILIISSQIFVMRSQNIIGNLSFCSFLLWEERNWDLNGLDLSPGMLIGESLLLLDVNSARYNLKSRKYAGDRFFRWPIISPTRCTCVVSSNIILCMKIFNELETMIEKLLN